jgi:hypothetical protein
VIFFNGAFQYGDAGFCKLLMWLQNLHKSTWDHEIVYADRYSEGEQLLLRPLPQKKFEVKI